MYYLNMNWKVFVYVLFLSNYTNGTWGTKQKYLQMYKCLWNKGSRQFNDSTN